VVYTAIWRRNIRPANHLVSVVDSVGRTAIPTGKVPEVSYDAVAVDRRVGHAKRWSERERERNKAKVVYRKGGIDRLSAF
jgi:hypothetical protein